MSGLALRVRLDPAPGQRAHLLAYPDDDLRPDFAVVAGGAIAIDLGPHAVAYRHGRLTPLPAGSTNPSVWLPDYLGGYLHRLASAVLALRPDQPTTAHLLDAPAALAFDRQGDRATVRYLDGGRVAYSAVVPLADLRAVVARALDDFLAALLALNPRLADQPDVVALRRQRDSLSGRA